MIDIDNLSISISDHKILKNINMNWQSKELIGVVGLNGAGKSSLFKSILQLGYFKNDSIKYPRDFNLKNDIGYLNETSGMFTKESVITNLIFFAKLNLLSKSESHKRIDYWIKFFKIESFRNKKMYELSKGNQQKVQFISSIIGNPSFLILDEPFSGIDPLNAELFINAIRYLNNNGTAIMYSSHQLEYVSEISEKIIFVKNGEIVENDEIRNIENKYLHISNYNTDGNINELSKYLINNQLVNNIYHKNEYEIIIPKLDKEKLPNEFNIEEANLNDIFKLINQ